MTEPSARQIAKVTGLIKEMTRRYLLFESGLASDLDDLKKPELQVLELIALYQADTVSEVARIGQVPVSTASWLVNNLVKQKYLIRQTDPEDRRVQRLILAERGEAVLAFLESAFSAMAQQMLSTADPEETAALVNLAQKMMDQFEVEG